jgi:hypothetical protein
LKPYHNKIVATISNLTKAYHTAVYRGQRKLADIVSELSGQGLISEVLSMEYMINSTVSTDRDKILNFNRNEDAMEDMWLCIRLYRYAVIDYIQQIRILQKTSMMCNQLKKALASRIRMLFVVTMQLFSHERVRVWHDSSEYLNNMCENMVSWNSKLSEHMKISQKIKEESKTILQGFINKGSSTSADSEALSTVSTTDVENAIDKMESMTIPGLQRGKSNNDSDLPNGNDLIIMQSIMQLISIEDAIRFRDINNSTSRETTQDIMSNIHSVKVMATTDGILHIFKLESKSNVKQDNTPYKSLLLKVYLFCNIHSIHSLYIYTTV